ncbi:MAG: methanogen output domain 1-containing protein [Candidatus Syntropharchaeia archaeon]
MEKQKKFAQEWKSVGIAPRMKWRRKKENELVPFIILKMVDSFGRGAIDVVSQAYHQLGKMDGEKIKRSLGIRRTDAHACLSLIEALSVVSGILSEFTEKEIDHSILRVRGCPFSETIKVYRSIICENYVRGIAEAVNPEAKVEVKKKICDGDDECVFEATI